MTFRVPSYVDEKFNVTWDPVKPEVMNYLDITPAQTEMRSHMRSRKVALWNVLIPAMLKKRDIANTETEV